MNSEWSKAVLSSRSLVAGVADIVSGTIAIKSEKRQNRLILDGHDVMIAPPPPPPKKKKTLQPISCLSQQELCSKFVKSVRKPQTPNKGDLTSQSNSLNR